MHKILERINALLVTKINKLQIFWNKTWTFYPHICPMHSEYIAASYRNWWFCKYFHYLYLNVLFELWPVDCQMCTLVYCTHPGDGSILQTGRWGKVLRLQNTYISISFFKNWTHIFRNLSKLIILNWNREVARSLK